ncbi:MAG: hypothetical protein HFG34_10980 [Eubacterium sp.]|nr:hypothetical protein [Eubacterium sp.]
MRNVRTAAGADSYLPDLLNLSGSSALYGTVTLMLLYGGPWVMHSMVSCFRSAEDLSMR